MLEVARNTWGDGGDWRRPEVIGYGPTRHDLTAAETKDGATDLATLAKPPAVQEGRDLLTRRPR